MKALAIDLACRAVLVPLMVLAVCVGALLGLHDLLSGQRSERFDHEYVPRRD